MQALVSQAFMWSCPSSKQKTVWGRKLPLVHISFNPPLLSVSQATPFTERGRVLVARQCTPLQWFPVICLYVGIVYVANIWISEQLCTNSCLQSRLTILQINESTELVWQLPLVWADAALVEPVPAQNQLSSLPLFGAAPERWDSKKTTTTKKKTVVMPFYAAITIIPHPPRLVESGV